LSEIPGRLQIRPFRRSERCFYVSLLNYYKILFFASGIAARASSRADARGARKREVPGGGIGDQAPTPF
jgi:hypothetical protein